MTSLVSDIYSRLRRRKQRTDSEEENEHKFGTFIGVYVPSILMLFGVIIFLRLGWIVGIAGLATTLTMIGFATLISLITILSISAIATNIEVKAGGIYYIISRSLGLEAGAAVGLPLYLKQALTIAFCVIGFAESLKDLVPSWDITSISLWTLGILTILAYASVKGALKVQLAIFIAIIASLISLFTGSEVAPMEPGSYVPAAPESLAFWGIFAILFPAFTGIESSISLSGDLKNPSKSLPPGTIGALLTGFAIYSAIAIFLTYRVSDERLAIDPLIMQDIASVPSLIIVGIWGATLSSALGGLLGAPRTLKAIADDGIAPKIFSKTYGKMEEPRIATLATCAIAFVGVYFGSVNMIAPLLTMIILICYGVLNLSAGIETLIANPSWRPRVRVHWAISLFGALLCAISMLMIAPGYALLSLLLVGVIYFVIKKRKFKAAWLDIQQGILLFMTRSIIYRLSFGSGAAKSWRPHFLVFSEFSESHATPLVKFADAIGQNKGFQTVASFVPPGTLNDQSEKEMKKAMVNHFNSHRIQSFLKLVEAESPTRAMQHMIQYCGLGPLVPNTLLFGGIQKENKTEAFVQVLQSAYSKHYNIAIMNDHRNPFEENDPDKTDVHIWWDDSNLDNSNLMLVFGYMLQCNPQRKNGRIFVKSIASNEFEKKEKVEFFQKLSLEKRLPIDIKVYVASNDLEDRMQLIKEFSKNAEIAFISLEPPPKAGEPVEPYLNYLKTLARTTSDLHTPVLILSSEHAPLNVLLQ